jgi:opacity protein-like surface antigen
MRTLAPLAAASLAVAALSTPAQALEYKFRVYGAAAYVIPIADSDFGSVSTEAAETLGWEVGIEWKPTNLLGVELAYLNAKPEIEATGTTVGEISLEPINVSANFHLLRMKVLTVWVGPTVSYANWGNLELEGGGDIETDSEFAYGASAGVNVSLIKLLALQAGVRWLKLDVSDSVTGETLDVDPFFVNLGLALRF